ncbi:MAG: ATP-binding cassette domain-containing protein [Sphingobacteriia bacterium]|nr:ATP-binding cassette domain-containing protein [Sphingobacteriia bacterium]
MNEVVSLNSVTAAYPGKSILSDISFTLQKGEFVYLVGSTGSGKSTLLKLLYGDMNPIKGDIKVGSYDLSSLQRKQIPFLRRQLGIVFQDFQLLPDRSISENIRFVMRATGWKDASKIKQKIGDLLMEVGLSSRADAFPHQLSGGEQQRIAIARALVNDPWVLLADEPTGNLDPVASRTFMEILFRIHLGGTAILMATHDYQLIQEYPARTLELTDGKLKDHPIGMFHPQKFY